MSHDIHNEKFLSLRQPAWHGLGLVIVDEIGAVEAGRRIKVPYTYTEQVYTVSGIATDHKAIMSKDDSGTYVHSIVTNQYYEILHDELLAIWDRVVGKPIETIGILAKGAGLFLTTKAPSFAVKGDEIQAYLMAENWLSGARANKVRKTPVRVVCQNTMMASDRNFISEIRLCHTKSVIAQFEAGLKEMMDQATAEYETVKEAFEILASTRLSKEQSSEIFTATYPDIEKPTGVENLKDNLENLKKMAAWERENGAQVEHRTKVDALYQGDGRGSLTAAAAGTAWGAWNAVVEYEQYLKKFRRAESAVFGAGADRMDLAYHAALAITNK